MQNMKKSLVAGISGQDGSFLAEFLLGEEYVVHGLVRRTNVSCQPRIEALAKGLIEKQKCRQYLQATDTSVAGSLPPIVQRNTRLGRRLAPKVPLKKKAGSVLVYNLAGLDLADTAD